MNIYDIDRQIEEIYDTAIDPETGEIDESSWDRLDELNMERDKKIEDMACWYKNTVAESDAIAAEIRKLQKRKEAADKKADWQQAYIRGALKGEKFTTPKVSVTFRKQTSVLIPELDKFCDKYKDMAFVKTKTSRVADKLLLRKYIQSGFQYEGAKLFEYQTMQIK